MHIEEVIIDGFKSYRHRTVVSGFHTHFNAITGLNGSGKSNILDAICFVLGITNLKHVRAQNLQDLVYKKGHGGVTKASVTIVFDNKDKETSPANYEAFDQITVTRQIQIGGTNKYLINGRNVDKKRLNALFLSVQLNVNNPHFLIMQGRVTKVLNMKPPEILSLIEEAAGTKLFEISKKESFSMIEKKDKKLNEIDSVLDEEVEPKMQQLKKERSAYLEFQKNQQEIDIRSRYVTAYHYCCNKSKYDAMTAEFVVVEKVMLDFNKRKSELVLQLKDTEQNLEILRKKKEAEIRGGLRDLDKEVQTISKKLVTETASVANATDTLNSETLAVAQFEESEKEALEAIEAKNLELEKAMNDLGPIEQAHITAAEGMEKAKRDLQAVRAGMSTGESDSASSFDDTIRQAENEQAAAESERQTRQMKVKHATAELKTKKPQAVQAEKTHGSATRQLKEKHSQLELMRTQLQALPFDKDAYDTLNNERKVLADRVRQLENTFESLKSENRGFTFNYSDPEPNFDRTKVHGLVARLIQIANENVTGALEVAAGGRLYNVVIDTQETGAKLLKRGRLRHRVTFIPLNRIAARTITPQQLQRAKQLVGVENAELALTLVGYPKEIEKAMQYVFGTTIVCTSAQAAQKVTYDRDVRTRCVTLDGDVYEPSGTLSGGSNRNKSSVLQRLQKLNQAEEEFTQVARELADLDAKLEMCTQQKTQYSETASALKNLQYQYDLLDKTIRSSPHGALIQEVADLEKAIADHTEAIQHATHQLKTAAARIEEVEKERKAFVNSRESQTEKMEKLLALQRKASQKATQKFKAHKEVIDGLELELQQMSNDHEGFDAQKADLKASVEKAKANLTARQQKLLQIEEDYDSANERLQKKREKLNETDAEMKKMAATKAKVEKEQGDLEIENKTAMHRKNRMQSELKDQADSVKHLLLSNAWIMKEEHLFGKPGTTYDFQNGQDPHESEVELQRLKAMQEGLKGQVNMEFLRSQKVLTLIHMAQQRVDPVMLREAMRMLDELANEHKDLLKKRDIVEIDKKKIIASIQDLDKKKDEQLKVTIGKVNKDFGSIFSMLLPGTSAKLAPPEGLSVLDGLEVKVAFGQTWKESLTELSGGQRSLIALSLILSLLMFKPAPMYILDEIDAALDLSHTQNIGNMLRTHFSQSQFIVVSLKEGMFDNANCLFRVRFLEGSSTVTRYVQDPHGKNAQSEEGATGSNRGKQGRISKGTKNSTGALDAASSSRPLMSRNV